MTAVIKSDFRLGATEIFQLPQDAEAREISVIGRSNVGKSSFINRITKRRNLARTSSTPGRTQEINLFDVVLRQGEIDVPLTLVDLPGFGYAKFAKTKREEMSKLTVDYILKREPLKIVCLLNDARRDPERDELALRDLVFESGAFLILIVTKVDKLTRNELTKRIPQIAACYGLETTDIITTGEKVPPVKFWDKVIDLLKVI
jgi:GTP-binding protein